MKGWSTNTIGQLCDVGGGKVKTGPFGSQLHESDYSETGTPFVMPQDILDGRINEARVARVSEAHVDRLHKHKLSKGDIIYGRRGDIGRQALIRDENIGWLCGSGCIRITLGGSTVTPEFLHRHLQMPEIIHWVEGQAIGATMPNLNMKILRRVPVTYPLDRETQNKIVAILSAYDKSIEINKRRIALLEKMAEEIYREWFVRLRFPGYEKVKSIRGVPEGWKILPFSEIVNINPLERIDRSEEIPFVAMEDLTLTSMFFFSKQMRKGGSGSKFRNRDVLFPRITPSVENGKRGFVMGLSDGQVGLGSTEFIVMREKIIGAEHIYFLTCSSDFRMNAELSMVGASGRQRVHEHCFLSFLVKTPPLLVRKMFSEVVNPLFSQIHYLSSCIDRLKKSRDLLLPRLISGKLSVQNLDIQFPPGMAAEMEARPIKTAHA